MLSDQPLGAALTLHPDGVLAGQALWQPLTAPFVFVEGRLSGLFFTLVVQWFVAGLLESFWGTRRYVLLVLGAGICGYGALVAVAGFVPSAGGLVVGGMMPVDLAAVAALGIVFGERRLQFMMLLPISTRALALIVTSVAVLSPLARGEPWPTVVPSVAAIAVAVLATTQPWRGAGRRLRARRTRRAAKGGHLKVVAPDGTLLN